MGLPSTFGERDVAPQATFTLLELWVRSGFSLLPSIQCRSNCSRRNCVGLGIDEHAGVSPHEAVSSSWAGCSRSASARRPVHPEGVPQNQRKQTRSSPSDSGPRQNVEL